MPSKRPELHGDIIKALTMLYLDHQDLSKLSPTELLDKYHEVYNELKSTNGKEQIAVLKNYDIN